MSDSKMEVVTSVVELAGLMLVAVGFVLWWLPAGLVVAGLELVGLGWLLAPTTPGRRR